MKKIMLILISVVMLFTACDKSSPKPIDPAEEFNGVLFGMTKEEVINVLGRQPDDASNKYNDSITYKNEIYFGINNTDISYFFADDGGLKGIIFHFYLSESTQDGNPIDLDLIKKELLKLYPEETFTYVKDEENRFSFQTDARVISLKYDDFLDYISVTIGDIGTIQAAIDQFTTT